MSSDVVTPPFVLDGLMWSDDNTRATTADLEVARKTHALLTAKRGLVDGELLSDGTCTFTYAVIGDFVFGTQGLVGTEIILHLKGQPPAFAVLAKSDHYNYGVLDTLEEAERHRGKVGENCAIVPSLGVEE